MSWTLHNEYLPSTAFGACFKCRSARRPGERILDPGLVTDDLPADLVNGHHDGYVMFCESCITEAASLLGMLTPLQVADLIADHAALIAEHEGLTATVAAQAEALAALRRVDTLKPSAK